MSEPTTTEERKGRHEAAIETLLARRTIRINGRQLLTLLAHLQANVSIQRRMTVTLASIAAGEAEWDAIEELAKAADFSADILDKFVFDLAEDHADHE